MKAAIIRDNSIEIEETQKPVLKDKGAIVKISGCGLCGSDIVKFKQKIMHDGAVLGHEIVGIIDEINTDTNFKKGDRIAMGHHYPCFDCVYCKGENYSMCETFKHSNIIPGGFAEYILIDENHLKNTVFKVDDTLSDIEASFLEPLACCVRAVRRADLPENSYVLVVGLGSIGFLMGQALSAFGHRVIGTDLNEDRLKLAFEHNFDKVIKSQDATSTSFIIKEMSQKEGVDAVFMTSGSDKPFSLALFAVRDGGTILIFASVPSEACFSNNDIYYRELKIMGSYSPSPKDLEISMKLLQTKKVVVENISAVYNLEEVQQAIEDTLSQKIFKAYIKL